MARPQYRSFRLARPSQTGTPPSRSHGNRFIRRLVTALNVAGLMLSWSVTAAFGYALFCWYRFFTSIDQGDNDFAAVLYAAIGLALLVATVIELGASTSITRPIFRRVSPSSKN